MQEGGHGGDEGHGSAHRGLAHLQDGVRPLLAGQDYSDFTRNIGRNTGSEGRQGSQDQQGRAGRVHAAQRLRGIQSGRLSKSRRSLWEGQAAHTKGVV
jgi:hypothetical protein